jgi:hypothetical protein
MLSRQAVEKKDKDFASFRVTGHRMVDLCREI